MCIKQYLEWPKVINFKSTYIEEIENHRHVCNFDDITIKIKM